MTDPLAAMLDALRLEVAAIRQKGGGIRIELRGGERIGQAEGSWLYRFVVVQELHLRDDTPVRLTAGQEDVPGVLVSFRDGVLIVALEKDVGPKIPVARLISDDAFLLERLEERLERVRSDKVPFARASADRVIGRLTPSSRNADPHSKVLADGSANDEQRRAVRRSLGSETTFVWGPPGTGKTTTLARIVEAHYRAGRSVLLVSNTNIAVDTALERIAERLEGEPDFHQGLVIRQGPVVKEELRRRFGPQVILDAVVGRLGETLRQETARLEAEAAPLEAEERSLLATLKHLERLAGAESALTARERARATLEASITARKREAQEHAGTARRLRADLERARTMSAVGRWIRRLDPERLERDALAAEQAATAARNAAAALAAGRPTLQQEIGALRAEVERLRGETGSFPPKAQLATRLSALRARLGQIRERTAAIGLELAELERQVLARCRILATTVYRTYLGKDASRQFDTVVIDEASMLMPPLVYYAAGLATHSVTVAGDFRQLPPIVMSDGVPADEWLKRDVFEIAGIPQRLARREPVPHLVALRTQYRMRKPICAVVNALFYPDHPLRSHPSVAGSAPPFPLGSAPLLYVNTAPFHPWAARRAGTYSRYNLFHALLVRNIVLHLAETGYLPPASEPNSAVGAVSPYATQARLIQALLDDRLGERAAGVAATVHRFQGNEKSAMLVDLTDSVGVPLGRFLQATQLEEDGARLLNVAVSRARHHVVLIGNFAYLRAEAPPDRFAHRLVDHFEEHGDALDLEALLPLAERDWIDGLHKVLPPTFDFPEGAAGAFTEGTFYPAFLRDLTRARESIVILSPFATSSVTSRWVGPLRAALARGVRVRVVTRPAEESGGGDTGEVTELVSSLRALGVSVDLRARMHEKIAIVDGRILWHGSLNILSHRDTHESMLRIESQAACQQIGRFLSTPAGRGDDEPALDGPENPVCPACGGPTVRHDGRHGIYFECQDRGCGTKVDLRRVGGTGRSGKPKAGGTASVRRAGAPPGNAGGATARACPQPGCSGRLVERSGRHGRFLGCTKYPACRYTENVP
ncbi:MAG: AAA domain-containing protein [Armatimonadota bacterium]|nr:AAA domain-containing protein [Armatimonadota bacterium]